MSKQATCESVGFGENSKITFKVLKEAGYGNYIDDKTLKEIETVGRLGGKVTVPFARRSTRNLEAALEQNNTAPLNWE